MWSIGITGGRVTSFLFTFLVMQLDLVTAQSTNTWKTLSGNAPAIIAKGGFSGLFPDSSEFAYNFALLVSSPSTVLFCDVRLTKDTLGICLPNLKMDNCTNIANFYPKGSNTYNVNGEQVSGYFPIDYNTTELSQVSLVQSIYTRSDSFDASLFPVLAVEDVYSKFKPPALWLNVEQDMFYSQHNLSMKNYMLNVTKRVSVNYISSPEIGFLTGISALATNKTKLIFRFLDQTLTEPSTNRTYGLLLSNLTYIKTFASGIMVPKTYIYPVTPDNYLLPYTTIVSDAHKAGLKIYAADFANDNFFAYNYSSDPLSEYLSYIDNGEFTVDGFISDFPVTPSEAIGCFVNLNKSNTAHGNPLIISHNGASGDYPDCTDLAYKKAINDGADIIDCPVQLTQDGILVCMSSINLMDDTTVLKSSFTSRTTVIPDLQSGPGIFTFNLTWDEIKTLKPQISEPLSVYKQVRNPRYANAGSFMNLTDFLVFAKDKNLSGIIITVENAAFLVENLGFSVVDSVISAINSSGYAAGPATSPEIWIQSTNSSVLLSFHERTKYKLLYTVNAEVSDVDPASITELRRIGADAVAVEKQSIFPWNHHYMTYQTKLVDRFQAAGFKVFVYVLMNEFLSQPYDFFSDPTVEINSYVQGAGVDGVITDFPFTARRYKENSCLNMGNSTPSYMRPVQPGGLLQLISSSAQPPALAPLPVLTDPDIAEAPLLDTRTKETPTSHSSPRLRAGTSISVLLVTLYLSLVVM